MALNFNNICRLCMGKKDALLPLFNERKGQIISLPAKIMNFVPIMKLFSGDGLPAQVCRQCVRLVNKSYKFKQQCESSDATLRQYLNNQSLSESTDEILHSVFRTDNGECWKFSTAVKKEAEEDSSIDDTAGPDNSDIDHEDHRISDTESVKGEQEWTSPEAGPSAGDPVKNQKKSDSPTRKLSKEKKPAKKWTNFVNVHETYEIKSEDEKPNDAEDVDNTTPRESANNHDLTNEIKVEPIVKTEAKTPRVKEKKIFLCHDCGKNFNRKQHLLLHLRTHTGEKPFLCKVCGESFGMSSNLNKHMRIHTGERPFLCTMCGKCFGRSDTLTKHMRCHTGEKPFHCNVCGNNFGRSSTLINHMRTHLGEKPYLCTDCGRRFVQSYDLTKHMRSHTGEKPYICTVCRMSFGQKHTLNKHMRNHTGELQFCPAGFQRTVPSEFQRTVTSEFQRTGSSEFQRTVPSEFQRTVPFVYYRPPVTDLSVERSAVLIGGGSQVQ